MSFDFAQFAFSVLAYNCNQAESAFTIDSYLRCISLYIYIYILYICICICIYIYIYIYIYVYMYICILFNSL